MIYLFGAGGHAKVIIEILEQQNKRIAGVIDVDPQKKTVFEYLVLQQLPKTLNKDAQVIIGIGNNAMRKKLADKITIGFEIAIHQSANISLRSVVGQGSVIMASVSINCNTLIGKHVILNTNCSVDHDCKLEDYVHISPNAALAGNVTVGEGTHIGIGACVIQGITIGKWVTIGAGAVIINNVPDYATVVGNPAKVIKIQSN